MGQCFVCVQHSTYTVYCVQFHHRISIQQEGKRGGGRLFFPCIEPNWPLPYTLGMLGRRAGSTVSVYVQEQCCKTGQQKVLFYCEDDSHCQSRYLVYLWVPSCSSRELHGFHAAKFQISFWDSATNFKKMNHIVPSSFSFIYNSYTA